MQSNLGRPHYKQILSLGIRDTTEADRALISLMITILMWHLPDETVDTRWFFHIQQWITTHGNTAKAVLSSNSTKQIVQSGKQITVFMRNCFPCLFSAKIQVIPKLKKSSKQAMLSFTSVFSVTR